MNTDYDLSLFRFKAAVEVRYADIDLMRHVNNAKYLTYIEQVRSRYFPAACGWVWAEQGMVLAKTDIDFRRPILLGAKPEVYIRTLKVGRSSFTQENILAEQGKPELIYARAISVLVHVDYESGQSKALPQEIRQKLAEFDGAVLS
jgi:acyl-CoA thioester hydrolase